MRSSPESPPAPAVAPPSGPATTPSAPIARLHAMARIRRVEEVLADHYRDDQQMRTPTHFSIGQEAPAVGVCQARAEGDVVYTGHRSHAPYLASGGDLRAMVAELHGRESGCSRGRGGSIHLVDLAVGFGGSAAILGEMISVATGAAWAFARIGAPRVALSFFGDGATEEGVFAESLNFAAVAALPIVFVCENNLYSISSPLRRRQPDRTGITARARAHGVTAHEVDGNDVEAVDAAARDALAHARSGAGPVLLELHTYRWREHVGPGWDHDHGYRSAEEIESWMARCPIARAADALRPREPRIDEWLRRWESEATAETQEAVRAALADPWPEVDGLLLDAYGSKEREGTCAP